MLVACPECGARYAIADELIPARGRRVECSACNHVWQEKGTPRDAAATGAERPVHLAASDLAAGVGTGATTPVPDDVRAILREEAEREARLRRERGLVEIGPEVAAAPGAAPKRAPHPLSGPVPKPGEIDASLRAASDRAAAARSRPARSGFAAGLVVGLCLVGLAALVYATAPRISAAVPEAAPTLEAYAREVDELRVSLDRAAARATASVSALLQSDG